VRFFTRETQAIVGVLIVIGGQFEEGLLQADPAYLEVARAGISRQELAQRAVRRVRVRTGERDGVAPPLGVGDAHDRRELRRGDVEQRRANDPSADPGLDLGGWAVRDDPSPRHQDDAIGEGIGLLQVVGGEDDGLALGGDLAHDVPEVPSALDVDGGGRLVEYQQVGIGHQRHGESHALGLSA
jgi:hypothetical protein